MDSTRTRKQRRAALEFKDGSMSSNKLINPPVKPRKRARGDQSLPSKREKKQSEVLQEELAPRCPGVDDSGQGGAIDILNGSRKEISQSRSVARECAVQPAARDSRKKNTRAGAANLESDSGDTDHSAKKRRSSTSQESGSTKKKSQGRCGTDAIGITLRKDREENYQDDTVSKQIEPETERSAVPPEPNRERKRRNLLAGLGSVNPDIIQVVGPLTRGMARPSRDGDAAHPPVKECKASKTFRQEHLAVSTQAECIGSIKMQPPTTRSKLGAPRNSKDIHQPASLQCGSACSPQEVGVITGNIQPEGVTLEAYNSCGTSSVSSKACDVTRSKLIVKKTAARLTTGMKSSLSDAAKKIQGADGPMGASAQERTNEQLDAPAGDHVASPGITKMKLRNRHGLHEAKKSDPPRKRSKMVQTDPREASLNYVGSGNAGLNGSAVKGADLLGVDCSAVANAQLNATAVESSGKRWTTTEIHLEGGKNGSQMAEEREVGASNGSSKYHVIGNSKVDYGKLGTEIETNTESRQLLASVQSSRPVDGAMLKKKVSRKVFGTGTVSGRKKYYRGGKSARARRGFEFPKGHIDERITEMRVNEAAGGARPVSHGDISSCQSILARGPCQLGPGLALEGQNDEEQQIIDVQHVKAAGKNADSTSRGGEESIEREESNSTPQVEEESTKPHERANSKVVDEQAFTEKDEHKNSKLLDEEGSSKKDGVQNPVKLTKKGRQLWQKLKMTLRSRAVEGITVSPEILFAKPSKAGFKDLLADCEIGLVRRADLAAPSLTGIDTHGMAVDSRGCLEEAGNKKEKENQGQGDRENEGVPFRSGDLSDAVFSPELHDELDGDSRKKRMKRKSALKVVVGDVHGSLENSSTECLFDPGDDKRTGGQGEPCANNRGAQSVLENLGSMHKGGSDSTGGPTREINPGCGMNGQKAAIGEDIEVTTTERSVPQACGHQSVLSDSVNTGGCLHEVPDNVAANTTKGSSGANLTLHRSEAEHANVPHDAVNSTQGQVLNNDGATISTKVVPLKRRKWVKRNYLAYGAASTIVTRARENKIKSSSTAERPHSVGCGGISSVTGDGIGNRPVNMIRVTEVDETDSEAKLSSTGVGSKGNSPLTDNCGAESSVVDAITDLSRDDLGTVHEALSPNRVTGALEVTCPYEKLQVEVDESAKELDAEHEDDLLSPLPGTQITVMPVNLSLNSVDLERVTLPSFVDGNGPSSLVVEANEEVTNCTPLDGPAQIMETALSELNETLQPDLVVPLSRHSLLPWARKELEACIFSNDLRSSTGPIAADDEVQALHEDNIPNQVSDSELPNTGMFSAEDVGASSVSPATASIASYGISLPDEIRDSDQTGGPLRVQLPELSNKAPSERVGQAFPVSDLVISMSMQDSAANFVSLTGHQSAGLQSASTIDCRDKICETVDRSDSVLPVMSSVSMSNLEGYADAHCLVQAASHQEAEVAQEEESGPAVDSTLTKLKPLVSKEQELGAEDADSSDPEQKEKQFTLGVHTFPLPPDSSGKAFGVPSTMKVRNLPEVVKKSRVLVGQSIVQDLPRQVERESLLHRKGRFDMNTTKNQHSKGYGLRYRSSKIVPTSEKLSSLQDVSYSELLRSLHVTTDSRSISGNLEHGARAKQCRPALFPFQTSESDHRPHGLTGPSTVLSEEFPFKDVELCTYGKERAELSVLQMAPVQHSRSHQDTEVTVSGQVSDIVCTENDGCQMRIPELLHPQFEEPLAAVSGSEPTAPYVTDSTFVCPEVNVETKNMQEVTRGTLSCGGHIERGGEFLEENLSSIDVRKADGSDFPPSVNKDELKSDLWSEERPVLDSNSDIEIPSEKKDIPIEANFSDREEGGDSDVAPMPTNDVGAQIIDSEAAAGCDESVTMEVKTLVSLVDTVNVGDEVEVEKGHEEALGVDIVNELACPEGADELDDRKHRQTLLADVHYDANGDGKQNGTHSQRRPHAEHEACCDVEVENTCAREVLSERSRSALQVEKQKVDTEVEMQTEAPSVHPRCEGLLIESRTQLPELEKARSCPTHSERQPYSESEELLDAAVGNAQTREVHSEQCSSELRIITKVNIADVEVPPKASNVHAGGQGVRIGSTVEIVELEKVQSIPVQSQQPSEAQHDLELGKKGAGGVHSEMCPSDPRFETREVGAGVEQQSEDSNVHSECRSLQIGCEVKSTELENARRVSVACCAELHHDTPGQFFATEISEMDCVVCHSDAANEVEHSTRSSSQAERFHEENELMQVLEEVTGATSNGQTERHLQGEHTPLLVCSPKHPASDNSERCELPAVGDAAGCPNDLGGHAERSGDKMDVHERNDDDEEMLRGEMLDCRSSIVDGVKELCLPKRKRVKNSTEVLNDQKGNPQRKVNDRRDGEDKVEEAAHVYSRRKGFLLASTAIESGGMRIRPRPLDPDLSIPILVEGRDKDFHEFDGGAFYRSLQLHESSKSKVLTPDRCESETEGNGPSSDLKASTVKKTTILVPSFRRLQDDQKTWGGNVGKEHQFAQRTKEADCLNQKTVLGYLRYNNSSGPVRHALGDSFFTVPSVYDMDDEDEEWLKKYNEDLRKSGRDHCLAEDTYEQVLEYFEREICRIRHSDGCRNSSVSRDQISTDEPSGGILKENTEANRGDRLGMKADKTSAGESSALREHSESFYQVGNEKTSPSKDTSEDCCICNGGENSVSNPVHRCQVCNISVHQSCYGICEADGNGVERKHHWRCKKCEAVLMGKVLPTISCAICYKTGGAMKVTVDPIKWAHVACALYTNETFFVDPEAMEPIDGLLSVEIRMRRQRDRCILCGVREGSCVRCCSRGCRAHFHISCGVTQGASFELRHAKQLVVGVRSFCPLHASPSVGARLDESHFPLPTKELDSAEQVPKIHPQSSKDLELRQISPKGGGTGVSLENSDPAPVHESHNTEGLHAETGYTPVSNTCPHKTRSVSAGAEEVSRRKLHPQVEREISPCGGAMESQLSVESTALLKQKVHNVPVLDERQQESVPNDGDRIGYGRNVGTTCLVVNKLDPSRKIFSVPDRELPVIIQAQENNSLLEDTQDVSSALRAATFDEAIMLTNLLKINNLESKLAPTEVMTDVYFYWRSKRMRAGGPILRELKQLEAAKSQGIFNKVLLPQSESSSAIGHDPPARNIVSREPKGPSRNLALVKMLQVRRQLEMLRTIAGNVIRRQELKRDDQKLMYESAQQQLLLARENLQSVHCYWCENTQNLLNCSKCTKAFCFHCFKHRRGYGVKGWIAASNLPNYICNYCLDIPTQGSVPCSSDNNISFPSGGPIRSEAGITNRSGELALNSEFSKTLGLTERLAYLKETLRRLDSPRNSYGTSSHKSASVLSQGPCNGMGNGRDADILASARFSASKLGSGILGKSVSNSETFRACSPDKTEGEMEDNCHSKDRKLKRKDKALKRHKRLRVDHDTNSLLRSTKRIRKVTKSSCFVYGSDGETTVSESEGARMVDKRTLKLSDLKDGATRECTNVKQVITEQGPVKAHHPLKFGIKFSPTVGKLVLRRHGGGQDR